MPGKVRAQLLSSTFLARVGVRSPSVLVGPALGEDAAIVSIGGGRVLVVHADPITGAVERLGWLAIHVAANDVAATGCKPEWFTLVVLLPEGTSDEVVDAISRDAERALLELEAALVGGHTEYTWGIPRPIACATAMGVTEESSIVKTGGARPGDALIATKYAALEAASILASDYDGLLRRLGFSDEDLEAARALIDRVSVVREALALARAGLAHSMHDPTEGGVIAGALEMALASGLRARLRAEDVPLHPVAAEILRAAGVDPLTSLSSGCLLVAVDRERVEEALSLLSSVGVGATVIGEFVEGEPAVELIRGGRTEVWTEAPVDGLISSEERLRKLSEELRGGAS
ncbi:MAG: AIR synthase family protein [Fervidicoccaceae archaeon]